MSPPGPPNIFTIDHPPSIIQPQTTSPILLQISRLLRSTFACGSKSGDISHSDYFQWHEDDQRHVVAKIYDVEVSSPELLPNFPSNCQNSRVCSQLLTALDWPNTKLSSLKINPLGPDLILSMVPGSRSISTTRGTYLPPATSLLSGGMDAVFVANNHPEIGCRLECARFLS
ncbi:hypothetical protein SSX86_033202 [Deinandra increscens subsp. villosa]|uniref:Uncharacterized protein n=1 Tax=Deinandra increscens subsp. villosa TaxID=3103831 RepID=A0AAP0GGB9_9ASTR